MRFFFASLILSLCLFPLGALPDDCVSSEAPLIQLLEQYSRQHGTKFVVDPRVSAKVTLIGIEPTALDAATLIGVLNIHGYTALAKKGIVYVMPTQSAEASGDRFGSTWEG
jgi:type II secretory pathway component GspD/PulD (secretin)